MPLPFECRSGRTGNAPDYAVHAGRNGTLQILLELSRIFFYLTQSVFSRVMESIRINNYL
jgi:hypothetical protein